MTLPLRDRLFGDTGLVITGATVQALLVTGGGTDAGTSSALAASTTTDVNGVWKFAALADAGAGNWYDIKIINGQQIRWRYGNIQSLLAAVILAASFTATAAQVWDFTATAGIMRALDPFVTGQFTVGNTITLAAVATSSGLSRKWKATGASPTITYPSGLLFPAGATSALAGTTLVVVPGETYNFECNGVNWYVV